jgi:hypothetical protein
VHGRPTLGAIARIPGHSGAPRLSENGVAVAEQFGDDGGADGAGAAGDEDAHGSPHK